MLTDRDYIQFIVTSFYREAIKDFLIGYQFRKIQQHPSSHPLLPGLDNFSHHIPRIIDFWCLQLLDNKITNTTKPFDLINVHQKLNLKQGELGRWVLLFFQIIEEAGEHPLKEKWINSVVQFQKIFKRRLFNQL